MEGNTNGNHLEYVAVSGFNFPLIFYRIHYAFCIQFYSFYGSDISHLRNELTGTTDMLQHSRLLNEKVCNVIIYFLNNK